MVSRELITQLFLASVTAGKITQNSDPDLVKDSIKKLLDLHAVAQTLASNKVSVVPMNI